MNRFVAGGKHKRMAPGRGRATGKRATVWKRRSETTISTSLPNAWATNAASPKWRSFTSLLGLKAGEQVADVACGHGRISNRPARDGMVVNGLDASAHYLDIARSQAEKWGVDL